MTEGIFPSSKTIEERKLLGLEEERRLCYVAITRAQKQLYLMDSEGTSQNGIRKLPSRFLREIGTENYERIGEIPEELDQESRAYSRRLDSGIVFEEQSDYNEGEIVTHHIFGKGRIISTDPARKTVRVQFDSMKMPRSLSIDYFRQDHSTPLAIKKEPAAAPHEQEPVPTSDTIPEPGFEEPAIPAPDFPQAAEAEKPADPAQDSLAEPDLSGLPEVVDADGDSFDDDETEPQDIPAEVTEESGEREQEINQKAIDPALLEKLNAADNLWKREDVPHFGWVCTGVTDLGAPAGICEMCGQQIIRYVHHMVHPRYHPLGAGCVCAGKMEGDVDRAKKREQDFKNKQARRASFEKRQWKRSRNGNPYLKIKGHLVVLYHIRGSRNWKFAIDSVYCDGQYGSREEAIRGAFQVLDKMLYGGS